jgi:hypothetical protein
MRHTPSPVPGAARAMPNIVLEPTGWPAAPCSTTTTAPTPSCAGVRRSMGLACGAVRGAGAMPISSSLVQRLDEAIAARRRPRICHHSIRHGETALGQRLGLELWVKDETGNVAGSHKARHLMGILLYLAVVEGGPGRAAPSGAQAPLAIASCGNAALGAAVLARAAARRIAGLRAARRRTGGARPSARTGRHRGRVPARARRAGRPLHAPLPQAWPRARCPSAAKATTTA